MKGLEDSAERRGLDLVGCGHSSGLYLRTRQAQQDSDARQKHTVPFFFPNRSAAVPRLWCRVSPQRHRPALLPIHEEFAVRPRPQVSLGSRPRGRMGRLCSFGPQNDKEQQAELAALFPRLTLAEAGYWLRGLNVRTPASVTEQTPAGSTRTTASSSAQNPRRPVWLIVIGTAATV